MAGHVGVFDLVDVAGGEGYVEDVEGGAAEGAVGRAIGRRAVCGAD